MVWPAHFHRLLLLPAFLALSFISQSANATVEHVFGMSEQKQVAVTNLHQWDRLIRAFARNIKADDTAELTELENWKYFIDSIRNKPKAQQLYLVNLWINQFPYKQDNWIYNQSDYWASPSEFFANGGDCEDYVITKYITLRLLGFKPDDMKMAIVYDVFSGTDHALLIVNHDKDSYILDNREQMTLPEHYRERYRPHYTFNEKEIWTFDSPQIVKSLRNSPDVLPGNR